MAGGGGGGVSTKATQYSWENSPVSRMVVGHNISGQKEAIIYANQGMEAGSLSVLTADFARKGMAVYFDEENGEQVLKVQNFSGPEAITHSLKKSDAVNGNAQVKVVSTDGIEKSTWQKIRENGVNIAGALGMLGHAGLFASGKIAKDKDMMWAGSLYGTSAGMLAIYGAGSDKLTARLCSGLYDHLQSEGLGVSNSDGNKTPGHFYHDRGGVETSYDWFKNHSLLVANLIGLGGNISIIKSAKEVAKQDGFLSAMGRGAHGAVNIIGAGIASFVPETSDEERDYKQRLNITNSDDGNKQGSLSRSISDGVNFTKDFISSSPLGVQGAIMLTDNVFDNYDAYRIRERYFKRVKLDDEPIMDRPDPEKFEGGSKSKEYKAEHKKYKKAWIDSGHNARLQENGRAIEKLMKGAEGFGNVNAAIKVDPKVNPDVAKCGEIIEKISGFTGKNAALDKLMNERKALLQQISEVTKYKKGWMIAALKAGAWTASSTFNMLSSKNTKLATEAKYGEIFANVATMALSVDGDVREDMVRKSAEYLAAQDSIFIPAREIEEGINKKIQLLSNSPWVDETICQSILCGTNPEKEANDNKVETQANDNKPTLPESILKSGGDLLAGSSQTHEASNAIN